MNAELKQQWIDALRSGEYRQGRKCLRDSREGLHCCLGVLCEIAPGVTRDGDRACYGDSDNCKYLPIDLSIELGLEGIVPAPDEPTRQTRKQSALAMLNDEGKSFAQIADWIETHL